MRMFKRLLASFIRRFSHIPSPEDSLVKAIEARRLAELKLLRAYQRNYEISTAVNMFNSGKHLNGS